MKTILALALTLFTAQSFANSFTLKKAVVTPPRDNARASQIWEDCFNQAQAVSFASGYLYLENSSAKCVELGLESIPFKQNGKIYVMDLPQNANPFSKLLRNAEVVLADFFATDITQFRLSPSHTFLSNLVMDMRLSTKDKDGIKYDYHISKRESIEGWDKINQVYLSTEQRTVECRPRMTCTFTVKNYEQTWKHNRNGQVVKMTIGDVQ